MKSIRIGNDIRIEWPIVLSGDVSKLQDLDLTVEVRPSMRIIDAHNYADTTDDEGTDKDDKKEDKQPFFEKTEMTVMMNGGIECRPDIGDGKEHCRPRPPRPCPPRPHRPLPPAPVKLPYHIEDNTLIAMWTADRQFATGDYDIILYAHKNEGGQAVCDQYRFVRLVSHTAQADAPDDSGIEAVIAMQPVTLELSGLSAYEVAVINGFTGTEEEWLASLKKPAEDAAEELKQEIEQFKEDTKEQLQADIKALGYYEDNPEFIRAYTDAEGKFLWGIRVDGSIEWAKGVPTPIQNALKELESKITENINSNVSDLQDAIEEEAQQLQSAIDVINASLKPLTDTFSYEDNPEFVNIITDNENKVLFGIKTNGKPYFPNNEMYHVIQNDEYLAAWVDANNVLLFGIKADGSTYIAKYELADKVEEIAKAVNGLQEKVTPLAETFSIISNAEWLHAVIDAENKLLFGIKADTGKVVMPKQDTYNIISNDEWLAAWLDASDKVLFGVKADGTFWAAKHNFGGGSDVDAEIEEINNTISSMQDTLASLQETVSELQQGNEAMQMLSVIDDVEERTEITTDAESKVLSYRDKDGKSHENVGIETAELTFSGDGMTKFQKALEAAGFSVDTPVDWSDKDSIYIPTKPTCAYMNITGIDSMPGSKSADFEATAEVWDMNGNYFKKNVILNAQGNSSLTQYKKNFAADFVDDAWDDSVDIKIGDWVIQDSFHFKAYYTDLFKFAGPVAYNLWKEMVKTRDFCESRPYMEYYADDYSTTWSADNAKLDDLEQNAQFSALCHPDCFPVIVYLNGDFYGIFSWQLKKDRGNYYTGRNDETQIHLDGTVSSAALWGGSVSWASFEVRNPKPKKWDLLCQDGSEYDGDNPKELMGEDSDYYDGGNESCVKSATTKNYILQASKYMSEIAEYEEAYNSAEEGDAKTAALATLKEEIEKRWSVGWMIDYLVFIVFCKNGDSCNKNVQWVSWGEINGVEKWFPCPYDLDAGFGVVSTTSFSFTAPSDSYQIGQNSGTPFEYIWKYYSEEVTERYKYFRSAGVFSYKAVFGLVLDWVKAIGYDNYELEYDKWSESPCNRHNQINTDLWAYTGTSYLTYSDSGNNFSFTKTYAKGDHVNNGRRCYESLQDNNVGHEITESEWWEDVSPKEGTYNTGDTVWDGYSNFYKFKAVATVTMDSSLTNRPFKKFYDHYPYEGGICDSIYRISKWIKERIENLDAHFGYSE